MSVHALITKDFLVKSEQGTIRQGVMQVKDENGRILYVGTDPKNVAAEFDKLMAFIETLLSEDLTVAQTFFMPQLFTCFCSKFILSMMATGELLA